MIERPTAFLPRDVFALMVREADLHDPNESGGVLMGYWQGRDAHILHAVGPGPGAVHNRYGFSPDQAYHEAELARIYRSAPRRLDYVGDWHSHPGGAALLSDKDRATLRRICAFKAARAPRPLMLILAPGPTWVPTAWQGELRGRCCWRRRLFVSNLDVRVADQPAATDPLR